MKRTPLKRKSRLVTRRKTPRTKAGVSEPDYLDHVRRQPCAVPGCTDKRVEAHHYGRRGLGQKCGDDEVTPLCGTHHRAWWHDKGHLPGLTPQESRELIRSVGMRIRKEWEGNPIGSLAQGGASGRSQEG